jgi:hypothetical protein
LPANVRLGWERLTVTNELTYYEKGIDYSGGRFCSPGPVFYLFELLSSNASASMLNIFGGASKWSKIELILSKFDAPTLYISNF